MSCAVWRNASRGVTPPASAVPADRRQSGEFVRTAVATRTMAKIAAAVADFGLADRAGGDRHCDKSRSKCRQQPGERWAQWHIGWDLRTMQLATAITRAPEIVKRRD